MDGSGPISVSSDDTRLSEPDDSERYKFIEKIGEGTFSEVWRVLDNFGACYAAKRMKKSYKCLEDVHANREVRAMMNLDAHPNVVTLMDMNYHAEKQSLILIFKLMDMSMYDFLRTHTRLLSENRVKNYLYQLVSGVNHLHRNEIIHRDIKPENILIKFRPAATKNVKIFQNELVQIGDLGSVCRVNDAPPRSTYVSTRWYRAPECILTTGYYGAKMDIWALGCCFFEMLTLQPLFPGENEMDQMQKIHKVLGSPSVMVLQKFKHRSLDCEFMRREPKSFYQLLPFLSAHGVDILTKTLSYHPDGRPTASKLLDHTYFEDQRKPKRPPLASKSTPRLENRAQEKPRQRQAPKHDLRSTVSLVNTNRKVAADHTLQVNKQREKLWGMNECPSKTKMFESIQRHR